MSSFDCSNVKLTIGMFSGCSNLRSIIVGEDFHFSSVLNSALSKNMFFGCNNLIGGRGFAFDESGPVDFTYAYIDLPGKPGYFTGPSSLY